MIEAVRHGIAVTLIASMLAGCGVTQIRREQNEVVDRAKASYAESPKSHPGVQILEGSLLMGEQIRASKAQPEIFGNEVSFRERRALTLPEIAQWITQTVHVPVVIDPSALTTQSRQASAASPMNVRGGPLPPARASVVPDLTTALPAFSQASSSTSALQQAAFTFKGKFGEFLDTVDLQYGVSSRYRDGVVTFFTTETRVFPVPTLPDTTAMNGFITTGDGSNGASSGGQSQSGSGGSTSGGSASSSGGGSGGQSMSLALSLTPWDTLQATSAAIAGSGATVIADKNLGVLSVTGTPAQCDRVEEWIKSLKAMYGKQVAIEVSVYQVQQTREENYGANLKLAYQSASGHTGITLSGAQAPTVTSTSSPMTLGANIVGGSLNGTTAAIQALSTLGTVTQLVGRSGVTQNGKLLALQSAKPQAYVQSTSTTLAASVGSSTSIQTSTIVPGFTSSFVPKVVDGRILIDFDMTLSDLIRLDTFTSGSGTSQSSVQLPLEQKTRFQQSISLKPGEALVLTGMRQQTSSVTNNGVGSPNMPVFGGGVDAQKGDTIISVVISARLL